MIQRPFNVALCIENLHLTNLLRAFKVLLVKKAGVYGFQHIKTGEILYIGSTINLWRRFWSHLSGHNSNLVLQRAFTKYGLDSYRFLVFEFTTVEEQSNDTLKSLLLTSEQFFLDSFKPRYNILPTAGSPFGYQHTPESLQLLSASHKGKTHSQESRDKMGVSKKGQNNPAYGRTGSLNPMFGVSASNAQEIYIYGKDNVLIQSFSSQVAAAQWLKVHQSTVSRYVKSGQYIMNKYYITNKLIT